MHDNCYNIYPLCSTARNQLDSTYKIVALMYTLKNKIRYKQNRKVKFIIFVNKQFTMQFIPIKTLIINFIHTLLIYRSVKMKLELPQRIL